MIQVSEDHSPIGAEALDAQSEDESWLAENLASLESTAAIGDGTLVHIRPIRHDDADGLVAFHDKLSASTVYYRFFNFHPHLSKVEATRFTSVDYWDRLALVAEHDGELIAVGRFDRTDVHDEAEVAFVVADQWQHRGLGPLLLARLVVAARVRGVHRFCAETLSNNRAMLAMFIDSGYDVSLHDIGGTVQVTFDIVPKGGTGGQRQGARC